MPFAPDLSGSALDDRYELVAVIGEGAFGRVYEGRDRRLDRSVAVKVIKPWWTDDPEWVAIFEREARLLARVSDPGIVQIYDVGHAPEGLYYVSELVDGENLAARLRRGPLPADAARDVAVQLCRALSAAHAARIVHRDVKPANILLSAGGQVKVGDFGVARLAEGSTDGAAATVVGTPRYMAPEQGRGRPTSPATDVYSVGIVLYEMLTGTVPFTGDTVVEIALRHLDEAPPALPRRVPASLRAITTRALSKDPADRFADAGAMADALQQAGRADRTADAATVAGPVRRRALVGAGVSGTGRRPRTRPEPGPGMSDGGSVVVAPPPRRTDETRRLIQRSPRRNVNPSGRRRAIAALAFVAALAGAMGIGAVALHGPARTRVPALGHLRAAAARTAARRAHLRVTFSPSYNSAPVGTIIGQRPAAGAVVGQGSTVRAVLSRGPAPVMVPVVRGETAADAVQSLRSLGLRTSTRSVPAAGAPPGTVTRQSTGGHLVAAGSAVVLSIAEAPRWRSVRTFTSGDSGPFSITGSHWRLHYSMSFDGMCNWIVFCSGPTARVVNATTGQVVARFGLNDGSGQVQALATGPGRYDVQVAQGGDQASWSVAVDDYF